MSVEMEDDEFEDVLDDWFIESLKTYRDLHVYQLEHPTQVIEWTSGKTVCVAGFRPSKNELLELRLPLKLLADENKGLCAERDFKVAHGGFTDGAVRRLKHVPGTRCVVTNDGLSSKLQVWELGGDDSDVIRRTGSVEGRSMEGRSVEGRSVEGRGGEPQRGSRIAARLSSQVLHGAQSGDVRLTELTSGRTLYKLETDSDDLLTSLQFVDDAVFLAGCCNGRVYVADTRTPAAPQRSPSPASSAESELWWADASAGPHPSGCRVVRLSSSGRAVVSDLRGPAGGAVCQAQLDVQSRRCGADDVTVRWAPVLSDLVSVSGFGGHVQIYDASSWGAEPQDAQPLFQHRGHAVTQEQAGDGVPVLVASHAWHPERPCTLLSAAADGSVHAWDWVDRRAAGGPTP